MIKNFPGLIETYHLSNYDPVRLFRKIGLQDNPKLRRRGLQKFVAITHPDHLRHVLVKANSRYIKSPSLRLMWEPYLGDGLISSSGPHWQKHRKILAPAFLPKMVSLYATKAVENAEEMATRWLDKGSKGEAIDLSAEFASYSLRLICNSLLTETLTDEEADNLVAGVSSVQSDTRLRDLAGFTEFMPKKPAAKRRQSIQLINEMAALALIRRRGKNKEIDDAMGLMLKFSHEETDSPLTDREILDQIKSIFLGGFEITALVLSWCIFLISIMPEEEAKLLKELEKLPSGKAPAYSDLQNLHALKRFIEEVMRLHTPGVILSRMAIEEDQIGNVIIPKGCIVEGYIWQTHRHPDFWDEPNEFKPERFHEHEVKERHKHAYLPFGSGPRSCIGKPLAMMELQLALATILKNLKFKAVNPELPKSVGAFVLRPDGPLNVVAARR